MAATTSISSFSTSTIQELILNNAIHSRRLLFHNPLLSSPPPSSDSSSQLQPRDSNTFDANVVMVLSVLLCALICSLALNSIIRCALRCSTHVAADSLGNGTNTSSAHIANMTGIKKKALKMFPTVSYTTDLKLPGLDTECAICLFDFAPGERVRVLPKCHHGFHIRCIDKWLSSHSSCPSCRNCLIEMCNKIVDTTPSDWPALSVTPSPHPQEEVIIKIEPLQPESMITNHEIN